MLTPLFFKDPILPTPSLTPIFQILSNPPCSLSPPNPTLAVLSVVVFLWLNGWSCHIWCAILQNNNMDLHVLSLGSFTLMFVYATRYIMWFFIGTLIWYHMQKHTAHLGTSRLTHPYKYIVTPAVMCSQQLPLLH